VFCLLKQTLLTVSFEALCYLTVCSGIPNQASHCTVAAGCNRPERPQLAVRVASAVSNPSAAKPPSSGESCAPSAHLYPRGFLHTDPEADSSLVRQVTPCHLRSLEGSVQCSRGYAVRPCPEPHESISLY
jgi:hypothetical protein